MTDLHIALYLTHASTEIQVGLFFRWNEWRITPARCSLSNS
jgi:hypothetical protein